MDKEKQRIDIVKERKLFRMLSILILLFVICFVVEKFTNYLKAVVLFLSLLGTISLAMSISPSADLQHGEPKQISKKINWWFEQSIKTHGTIQYNPLFFYIGLVCLGLSMVLNTLFL